MIDTQCDIALVFSLSPPKTDAMRQTNPKKILPRRNKMTLVRFDPFREMTVAQNRINHVLADAFAGAGSDTFGFLPPVDIRTSADHTLII